MTDKEILRMWREKSGPINVSQDLDPDISFPYIVGISFEINDNKETYISSVKLPDHSGRSFISVSPQRLYTGPLKRKFTDKFS